MADEEKCRCCWLCLRNKNLKERNFLTICLIVTVAILILGYIIIIVIYEVILGRTCRKSECVEQSSLMMGMMDRSMNPCENFYQYSCGSYMTHDYTRDKSVLIEQIDKLNDLVKVLLTDNVKYSEPRFLSFPKMLYKSCMDQDKIFRDDIKPVKEIMKTFGGWPVTLKYWDEYGFSWIGLIKQLRERGLPFGYLIEVNYIEEQGVKLLFRGGTTYRNLTRGGILNEEIISSYLETLINLAVRFGGNETIAKEEMKDVIEFEIQLANSSESSKQVERITIYNLQKKYPLTNWLVFVRSSLGLNVQSSEIVLIVPVYLEKLEQLLKSTPPRLLANYILTKVHLFIVELLPKAVISDGPPQPYEERQKLCIDFIRSNLWLPVAALYQQRYFNEKVSEGVIKMLGLIKNEFAETIKSANWLNDASKEAALKKLKSMEVQIAFPSEIMDTKKLDHFHGDFGGKSALGTWSWVKDFVTGVIQSFQRTKYIVSDMTNNQIKISANGKIEDPKESIDKSANSINGIASKMEHRNTISKYNWRNMGDEAKWLGVTDQVQVRIKFEPEYNRLDIRAGILRGGFYHNVLPYYVNFGAIGTMLAHELVHSIDNRGKYFDENGQLRQPWKDNSKKAYQKKFKCLINQYNNYVEPLTGKTLNGIRTLEENIADNIALQIAYKAYLNWIKQYGHDQYLPGLNLTAKQLFWVSNAQTQCANPSVDKIIKQLELSDTVPERFRIIGSISNNKDFSKDFKCPLGSAMNPTQKCDLI